MKKPNTTQIASALFLLLCVLALQAQDHPPRFDFREYAAPQGEILKYVVYEPLEIEPGGRYPLLVFLHGSCGECVTHERILRESNLRLWHGYDDNVQVEPIFLFAPVGGRGGWTGPERTAAVLHLIDSLIEEFPIDRRRIYLQGFSMGGAGTWHLLQQRPGFFAAANPQASGGGVVDADKVKDTPIWATIGGDDRARFRDELSANVGRIREANGDPRGPLLHVFGVNPRLSVFPDTPHGGAQGKTQELRGFLDWFYSQVNDGNVAPNVRFVRPVHGAEYYSTSVEALVSATDPDGAILRVELFVDGKQAAVVSEAPFRHVFTDLAPGTRRLSARAVDIQGKSRTAEIEIMNRSPSQTGPR